MNSYMPWLTLICVVGWITASYMAISVWALRNSLREWKDIWHTTRDSLESSADYELQARLRLYRLIRSVHQRRFCGLGFRNSITLERVQGFADTVDGLDDTRVDILVMMDGMFPPTLESEADDVE